MQKIKQLIQEFTSLEGSLFRYSLSYSLLLAVLPGLFLLVLLFQYSIIDISPLLDFLYRYIPVDLISPFIDYLLQRNDSTLISTIISLGIAVYVASQCFYSFLLFSAHHEGFKTYHFIIRIKAILLYLFFMLSLGGLGILLYLFSLSSLFAIYLLLILFFVLFYQTLSFCKHKWHYGVLGALFSSTAIYITGVLFLWVVQTFTSYDSVYGPLASLMILFLSVYVLSSLIYFGFCLNTVFQPLQGPRLFKRAKLYQKIETLVASIKLRLKIKEESTG